ncbi:hypothetical protein [Streptosporangium sp. NPDC051022]|uniref:hypothetical protein n=1 Tax=Streptosporangium sp. NPDC051022 TaxID=3155752 RepID=UPI003424A96F
MSAVERMSAEDLRIIKECLDAAVNRPFFPDWEFQTLMGLTRGEIAAIAAAWPSSSEGGGQDDAVNNVLNMLLGYPHDHESRWHKYSSATPERIARVPARWRGDDGFDGTAKGAFDRLR